MSPDHAPSDVGVSLSSAVPDCSVNIALRPHVTYVNEFTGNFQLLPSMERGWFIVRSPPASPPPETPATTVLPEDTASGVARLFRELEHNATGQTPLTVEKAQPSTSDTRPSPPTETRPTTVLPEDTASGVARLFRELEHNATGQTPLTVEKAEPSTSDTRPSWMLPPPCYHPPSSPPSPVPPEEWMGEDGYVPDILVCVRCDVLYELGGEDVCMHDGCPIVPGQPCTCCLF